MIKKYDSKQVLGPKALEMVMRDVLGGMEDIAIMKSYETDANIFKIEAIDGLRNTVNESDLNEDTQAIDLQEQSPGAKIISFEQFRSNKNSPNT
jgi:hypothetical protein